MRLIDADLLRAEFTGNFSELWHYTGILAMIDCAPTAYDIDKVLSELRKCRLDEQDAWNGLDDECAFGGMTAYSHAIEIVKGGENNG